MSEHLKTHEQAKFQPKSPEAPVRVEATHEVHKPTSEHAEHAKADAREHVRELAEASHEDPFKKLEATQTAAKPIVLERTHHAPTRNDVSRALSHIQNRESATEKVLSKTIHQPIVRVVSEGTAKTITRPSGLLGGGITAFVGSLAYYYFTKHIGIQYNYFVFALFFIGGFAIGLLLEAIIWFFARRHQHSAH
jgi:hypothetical protein